MSLGNEIRKVFSGGGAYVSVLMEKVRARGEKRACPVILDDIFPYLYSAFRIAEFNALLLHFPGAQVHSSAWPFVGLGEKRRFEEVLDEYERHYPELRRRVIRFHRGRDISGSFAYMVFLENAHRFMRTLKKYRVPFAVTLYPGGGFRLEQEESDRKLREVFSSSLLTKVIVTQKVTREYLLDRGYIDPSRIEFIYGGVFPSDGLASGTLEKPRYPEDKKTFDMCFVAFKYMKMGLDKGYDVFVAVARELGRACPDIRFHVVGPFDATDIDVSALEGRFRFYGSRNTDFFRRFYREMDVILSPNIPYVLFPGAFDGFPTGACIEAGMSGVAVFCTDPLRQNIHFRNGEDIVIVSGDPKEIASRIREFRDDPEALYRLSARGQESFRTVFDIRAQMEPRIRILSKCMLRCGVSAA
jgi:glycosyltransferase involved in cell wall biosynthesis